MIITAEALAENGNPVEFTPEGLQFAVPATLELKYDNCKNIPQVPKVVIYTDNLGNILGRLNSLDDNSNKKVLANLNHFSKYAVAW